MAQMLEQFKLGCCSRDLLPLHQFCPHLVFCASDTPTLPLTCNTLWPD